MFETTFQGLKTLTISISNLFSPFQTLKEELSNRNLLQRFEMTQVLKADTSFDRHSANDYCIVIQ